MANQVATAYVAVVPSTRGFGRALTGQVDGQTASAGKRAGMQFGGALKAAGLAAAIGAAIAIGDQFAKGINDAVASAESLNKVQVVFGDASKSVEEFANRGAKALGLSKGTALEYTGTLGNLLVAVGLSKKRAAEFSTTMVQLSADMASFNNTSPEEALEALRSGLSGETEPLKRFGVNLNEAILKQKALDLGLIKTTKGTLPPAIRTQAAYAVIMEQTKTAQGDFARTSEGVANQQRIIAAQWEDIRVRIVSGFLPAIQAAQARTISLLDAASGGGLGKLIPPQMGAQLESLKAAFMRLVSALRPAFSAIAKTAKQVVAEIAPTFVQLGKEVIPTITVIVNHITTTWKTISPVVLPVIQAIVRIVGGQLKALANLVRAIMAALRGDWKSAWSSLKAYAIGAVSSLVGALNGLFASLARKAANASIAIGRSISDGIKRGLQNTWNGLVARLKGLVNMLPEAVKKLLGINSPSRVFAGIGASIPEGMVLGISGGSKSVNDAIGSMIGGATAPRVAAYSPASATQPVSFNITGSRYDAQMISTQVRAVYNQLSQPIPSMG